MRRYLGIYTTQDFLNITLNLLFKMNVIAIFFAIISLVLESYNISKIEEIYEESQPHFMLEETGDFWKGKMQEYIKAFELSEEISVSESIKEIEKQSNISIVELIVKLYYYPTEEERLWAYLMAVAEAGLESQFGQTLVTNVAINRAIQSGGNLIDVFTKDGQYSSIHNGVPHICIKHEDGSTEWILITEDMITDEVKEAVDRAFKKDYTEELLKEEAIKKGLSPSYYEGGALYFHNPKAISQEQSDSRANIKVSFQFENHVFYRIWNK